jgi:hypothetical protein
MKTGTCDPVCAIMIPKLPSVPSGNRTSYFSMPVFNEESWIGNNRDDDCWILAAALWVGTLQGLVATFDRAPLPLT